MQCFRAMLCSIRSTTNFGRLLGERLIVVGHHVSAYGRPLPADCRHYSDTTIGGIVNPKEMASDAQKGRKTTTDQPPNLHPTLAEVPKMHSPQSWESEWRGTTMRAWTVEAFGNPLILRQMPIPTVHRADQILIRVKAASINPIDVLMAQGYGDELLRAWKQLESGNFNPITMLQSCLPSALRSQLPRTPQSDSSSSSRLPLVAGRDCSGEVLEVGAQVRKFKPGDKVIAVIPATWPGSHADYVLTSLNAVARKPKGVSHVEATSMAYTACTSWSALVTMARLNQANAPKNRVLIHGGSGGIGTTAIQLLKAWGVPKVVATCSTRNMPLVESLGAVAVDYTDSFEASKQKIIAEGPYEVVLDCVDSDLSRWSDSIMGSWRNCVHISLVTPLLRDTDRYGVPMGLASSVVKQFLRGFPATTQGKWFCYSAFYPSAECLEQLSWLMEQGKMKAIVDEVFNFDQLPEGYDKVSKPHSGGKRVIDFDPKS